MSVLNIVFFVCAVIGALDYIIGNKFKVGKEFERGFTLFGSMALSMVGMLVLAPAIGGWLRPAMGFVRDVLHLDPSIIPASLLANDMGGFDLAVELASDARMGEFNGLVVAATMGAILSFTVPFSLGVVKKEQHDKLLLGLLCGVAAIPFGCFAAGLVCGLPIGALLVDLLPLVLLATVIALGLWFRPELCVRIFRGLAFFIKALVTVGLLLGAAQSIFGLVLIEGLAPIEDAALVCFRISLTLCGVFPLVHLLSRLLLRPLRALGQKIGINEVSVLGLIANLASNSTVFGTMDKMDDKGAVLNAAFAASAAFVFGSHLAFTQARGPEMLGAMMTAKLVAGALALLLAWALCGKVLEKKKA